MLRTPKASPRMDESSFRLEQVGVTPEQMSVVTFQNDTSLFGVFEKATGKSLLASFRPSAALLISPKNHITDNNH
jgi:hypothetical protein